MKEGERLEGIQRDGRKEAKKEEKEEWKGRKKGGRTNREREKGNTEELQRGV